MSEVISFRLRQSKPKEARALEILRAKVLEGLSIRDVITEGLLLLSAHPSLQESTELASTQAMFSTILDILKDGSFKPPIQRSDSEYPAEINALSESFIATMKKEAKKGLKSVE